MVDKKTSEELLRFPVFGEEEIRLALTGANYKTTLGNVFHDLGRPKQADNIYLYVSTAGNDTTGDGSQGNPFKTPQRAMDRLMGADAPYTFCGFESNGWVAVIQLADGTYTMPANTHGIYVGYNGRTGGGSVYIQGNASNPEAVKLVGNGPQVGGVFIDNIGFDWVLYVQHLYIQSFHCAIFNGGQGIAVMQDCVYDNMGNTFEAAIPGAVVFIHGTAKHIGYDGSMCFARYGGAIFYEPTSIEFVGSNTMLGIARITEDISLVRFSRPSTITGTRTGQRFLIHSGTLEVITPGNTGLDPLEYIPGNAKGKIGPGGRYVYLKDAGQGQGQDGPYGAYTGRFDNGRIKLTANKTFYVAVIDGTVVGGSGYATAATLDHIYLDIPLTGGSGTGAVADIIVAAGAVIVVKPSAGTDYAVGDVLTCNNSYLGGTGSGFTFTITAIGDDDNDGESATSPCRTLQHVYNYISDNLDLGGYDVTIQCAHGKYISTDNALYIASRGYELAEPDVSPAWVGGGNLTIQGDITSADARKYVTFRTDSPAWNVFCGIDALWSGVLTTRNLQAFGTRQYASCFQFSGTGMLVADNCDTGGTDAIHYYSQWGAKNMITGDVTIYDGGQNYIFTEDTSYTGIYTNLHLLEDITFTAAFIAQDCQSQVDYSVFSVDGGTIHGEKFYLYQQALLHAGVTGSPNDCQGDGDYHIYNSLCHWGGYYGGLVNKDNIQAPNIILSPPASVTPVNNGELTFEATSNTQLTFKLKGSDGTVRSGTLTLS